jgi:shikimate kinase
MGVILWGYQSSGKTSVARAYAARFGVSHIDIDEAVLAMAHQKTGESFSTMKALVLHLGSGEACRAMEEQVIQNMSPPAEPFIISTGGWTILNPHHISHLRSWGSFVYLKVSPDILFQRMQKRGWPSFIRPEHAREDFNRYHESRVGLYERVCEIVLDVDDLSVDDIAERLTSG